jgi:hypothetical protein
MLARSVVVAGLVALLAAGCARDPAEKVVSWPRRWPRAALPADASASPLAADARSATAAAGGPADGGESPAPCEELIQRACEALGRHSEECLEGRSLLPRSRPPEWRAACAAVLAAEVGETDERRLHPCRRLERTQCADLGHRAFACRQAREDASRLRRKRRPDACLGDLLLWRARKIFSGPVGGSGR